MRPMSDCKIDQLAQLDVESSFKRSGFNRFAVVRDAPKSAPHHEGMRPAVQFLAGLLSVDMRRTVPAVVETAISDLARKRLRLELASIGSRQPSGPSHHEEMQLPLKHSKLHGVKRLQTKNNTSP